MKTKIQLRKLNARGFSHDIGIVVFAVIFAIVGVGYLVATHADSNCKVTEALGSQPVCNPASGPVSSPVGTGEQLSIPPQRRPAQYVHVCYQGNNVYVTQGSPNCLLGDAFKFDYGPTVAGTVYSIPCKTTKADPFRYVYISSGEVCPGGTWRVALAAGEQLSQPPARRPAQYVHVCYQGNDIYVTQGSPNCLAGGTFKFDYGPTVAGTYYSVPCYNINGLSVRYVYISSFEACPSGTVAVSKT